MNPKLIKKTFGIVIFIVFLLAIPVLSETFPRYLGSSTDDISCEVYRDFYNTLPDNQSIYLRSLVFNKADGVSAPPPPEKYISYTGNNEFINYFPDQKNAEKYLGTAFDIDATINYKDMWSAIFTNIENCFNSSSANIFFNGTYGRLAYKLRKSSKFHDYVFIWKLSKVSFSEDKKYASFYGTYGCRHYKCRGAHYYLLEHNAGSWRLKGYKSEFDIYQLNSSSGGD